MSDPTRLPPDDVIRVRVKAELRKRIRGEALTDEERQLANDPHQRQRALWQRLRTEVRQ